MFLAFYLKKEIFLTRWISRSYTNSMERSPSWEANRSSASQEISRILWNQGFYSITAFTRARHLVPILSQFNPVHTPSHFFKILFNITFPPAPVFSKWSLSQNLLYTKYIVVAKANRGAVIAATAFPVTTLAKEMQKYLLVYTVPMLFYCCSLSRL